MVSLEDLGLPSYNPNEKFYKLSCLLLEYILKNSFETYGSENLREDSYQMFLCNHKFYADPVMAQLAIIKASGNNNPIPSPAYKSYIKHKALGPLMTTLFSFPIYGKEDGYKNKEKSMQYSVNSFLKQKRILVFPEGKIAHDGKLETGKIGSAEIAWRTYHKLKDDNSLESKKGYLKMIPTEISYSPIAGMPFKDIDEMTISFGNPIDFEEVLNEYCSLKNKFKNKKKLKRSLQSKLMRKVMREIGLLTHINLDQVMSRILYDFAKKNQSLVEKEHLHSITNNIVESLNRSDKLNLSNHLKTKEETKSVSTNFLSKLLKKEIVFEDSLYNSILHLNLDYILSEPKFEDVRNENIILYNYNLLEHLGAFKRIVKKEMKKVERS